MAKKEVHVDVKPDGEVVVSASGFKGKDCADATEPYENELGSRGKRKWKPVANVQKNNQGVNIGARNKHRS